MIAFTITYLISAFPLKLKFLGVGSCKFHGTYLEKNSGIQVVYSTVEVKWMHILLYNNEVRYETGCKNGYIK